MSNKVLVIGAQNIDIIGSKESNFIVEDSNIGDVLVSVGGVGRNIAGNLNRLNLDVNFLSVFGDDLFTSVLIKSLEESGIKYAESLFSTGANSYYLAMNQHNDLFVALNDMKVVKKITPSFIKSKLDYINSFEVVCLDNNLSKETLDYISKHATTKIVIDAVSASKVHKLNDILNSIYLIKCNKLEALTLSNTTSIEHAIEYFKQYNAITVITDKDNDIHVIRQEHTTFSVETQINILNASGAGDAFISGLIYGIIKELELTEMIEVAKKCARIALKSKTAIMKEGIL